MTDRTAPIVDTSPAADAPAYCWRCAYSLRGLTAGRCPECGRPFDRADRGSFATRTPRQRVRRWARRIALLMLVIALAVATVPGWYWWRWRAERQSIDGLRALGAIVAVRRFDPEGLEKYLPDRWAFLRDHATEVELEKCTADRIGRVDLRPLSRLEILSLMDSNVDDALVAQLQGATRLRYVCVWRAPMNGAGLIHLAGCRELIRLDVPATKVDDAALVHVGRMTSLAVLDLEYTNITDAGLSHLTGLMALERLDLWGTPITDAGILQLADLPSLRSIRVNGTKVTEQGKRAFLKRRPEAGFYE